MSETAPVEGYSDEQINTIVSLRIYDVLMGLLRSQDAELHRVILEAHTNGRIIGPSVFFDGTFLQDDLNV